MKLLKLILISIILAVIGFCFGWFIAGMHIPFSEMTMDARMGIIAGTIIGAIIGGILASVEG